MELFTPASMIAGRIPVTPSDAREAVFHAAASLLDTEQIRFVMTVSNDYAWYLAAPASDFGNFPESGCVLEAALPDAPGHRGNGAYVASLSGSVMMAVIKADEGLKTFLGRSTQIDRFLELNGVVDRYAPSSATLRWDSFAGEARRKAIRLLEQSMTVGLCLALVACLLWSIAAAVGASRQGAADKALASQRRAMEASAAAINGDSMQLDVLKIHRLLTKEVMEDPRARIKRFKFENGLLSWQAVLPATTPPARLRLLAEEIKVADATDGLVNVEGVTR